MPPKVVIKPAIKDIVEKAVERLGRKQLWKVVRAVRHSPNTAEDVRESLRSVGIFLSDDLFQSMVADYGEDNFDKTLFLKDFAAVLSPRRRHVVDLVIKKLDPEGSGVITYETFSREYDVLRHPDVVHNIRSTDDVEAEFFDSIMDGGEVGESTMTTEELIGYYVGISFTTPKDEDFELLCIRSFCLDRPKLNVNEEVEQLQGSRAHSRQSRLLGEGRAHPLYTTSNKDYGKEVTSENCVHPQHGLSQKFTKNAPSKRGGATGMNM